MAPLSSYPRSKSLSERLSNSAQTCEHKEVLRRACPGTEALICTWPTFYLADFHGVVLGGAAQATAHETGTYHTLIPLTHLPA